MHALIPAVFSLFFLPLPFFHSVPFFTFSFLLSCCGLFPIWSFRFLGPSLQVRTTLLLWVFPLRCLCPLGSPSFGVFLSSVFFLSLSVLFFCRGYLPFIVNRFNVISPFYPQGFTNCFWFVVGILLRLPTHPLVAPAIAQYMFAAPLLISRQNSLLFVPAMYLYLTTQLYGMHQMVPTIYYFFWVRYHPSRIYSQKKSWQETKYRPPFPSTTKPHPLNPLNRGPTSLVLAGYRLVVLRLFCACSIIFCVCLPRRFYRSKLALFCYAAWLCLISSHVSYCVLSFSLV